MKRRLTFHQDLDLMYYSAEFHQYDAPQILQMAKNIVEYEKLKQVQTFLVKLGKMIKREKQCQQYILKNLQKIQQEYRISSGKLNQVLQRKKRLMRMKQVQYQQYSQAMEKLSLIEKHYSILSKIMYESIFKKEQQGNKQNKCKSKSLQHLGCKRTKKEKKKKKIVTKDKFIEQFIQWNQSISNFQEKCQKIHQKDKLYQSNKKMLLIKNFKKDIQNQRTQKIQTEQNFHYLKIQQNKREN